MSFPRPISLVSVLVAGLQAFGSPSGPPPPPVLTADGVALARAVLPPVSSLTVTAGSAVSAKLVVDGAYVGTDSSAPFSWRLTLAPGPHSARVRVRDAGGAEVRAEAEFTVAGTAAPSAPPATSAPTPAATTVPVATVSQLRSALASARPGTTIQLADGDYPSSSRLEASASGTASAPITLRGSRAAVLRSTGPSGDYGLHVTGSYWRVEGLTVAHASKGIVLDRSVGTVLDGVEVYDTGAEGVHFRTCSSDGVLRRSTVRNTGVTSPQYGEGVYVGSASSNWATTACQDGRDGTARVLVEDNVFRDVPAEGADVKEGSTGGTLRRNTFDHTGYAGANSADSAVDVKGNGWLVDGNTVQRTDGDLDAFQTHTVVPGWGTGTVFRSNVVAGALPGYGIGLYPSAGNVVECSNRAPAAVRGLTNTSCR